MCEGIMKELSDIRTGTTAVIDGMCSALKESTETVRKVVTWCGHGVSQLSHAYLPRPVAGLVTRAVFAAPYAAAFMYLPNMAILVAVIAYVALHVMHPSPFNARIYQDGYTGLAIKVGSEILKSAYAFAQTGMRSHVVDALVNLIITYTLLDRATKFGPKDVYRSLEVDFTEVEPGATNAADVDAGHKSSKRGKKQAELETKSSQL